MRTILSSSQLIYRFIISVAKLIDLRPEMPLFGRYDKLVRDLFETMESVYNFKYKHRHYAFQKGCTFEGRSSYKTTIRHCYDIDQACNCILLSGRSVYCCLVGVHV